MKTKQQIDHDAAGAEVKRLLKEGSTATASLKGLRQAKIERKEQLKKALTVVWTALESGATVNGYTTKETWAKEFAKVTIRHCQHIINGRKKEEERTTVRFVNLDEADGVILDGKKWMLDEFNHGLNSLNPLPAHKNGAHVAELNLIPVAEAPKRLTTAETKAAIHDFYMEVGKGKDALSVAWVMEFIDLLREETKRHSEWREKTVEDEIATWGRQKAVNERYSSPKVKQITSKLTNSMIIREVGSYGANVNSLEDNEEYSEKFEAAVKAHPEWFSPLVERLRKEIKGDHFLMKSSRTPEKKKKQQQEMSEPAKAVAAVVGCTVEVAPKAEGAYGTELRLEAANAAYGEKKVSKKVYLRILAGLEKYQEYVWTQHPPVPECPENATVVCEGDDKPAGYGRGMIISTSPEYDAWEAARMAAESTPEYAAWTKEFVVIGDVRSALIQRYDPLKKGDLDGDDEGGNEEEL